VVALLEPWRRPFIDLYCMLLVGICESTKARCHGSNTIMNSMYCSYIAMHLLSTMRVRIHTFGRAIAGGWCFPKAVTRMVTGGSHEYLVK